MLYDNLLLDLKERFEGEFDKIPQAINAEYKLSNILMCGFALFALKDASLLKFIKRFKVRANNLKTIFHINQSPSDTVIRTHIDEIETKELKKLFKPYILELDNQGILKNYEYLENYLYIPMDGTGYFSSKKINCDCCLETHHQNGEITYSHKALCACIVSPKESIVFPVAIEDISKTDGETKNDCETNAAKRLIPQILLTIGKDRDILFGGDAIYGSGPMLKELQKEQQKRKGKIQFIFNAKPGSHKYLFEQFKEKELNSEIETHIYKTKKHKYVTKYCNNLIINKSHLGILVNFLYFEEHDLKTGKIKVFSWITDIPIKKENYTKLVKIGRSRWKIENNTINTLKNQGYNFEHNFGHSLPRNLGGKKNLSANFAVLMFLAFLFDQIQQSKNRFFRMAKTAAGSYKNLWNDILSIFDRIEVPSMEVIYKIIAKIIKLKVQLII